jgi:hypothetical protein
MFIRRHLYGITLTVWALVATALGGCANTPLSAAQDTAQRAYALYGSFVIIEEQGAQIVRNPSVDAAVKSGIRVADARAKPSADALAGAVRDYLAAQAAVTAGGTGATALLSTATANLQRWVTQADTDITALITAVTGNTPGAVAPKPSTGT